MRKFLGIWLLVAGVLGLRGQEFSVFYIASPNGTLSWCRCPDDPYGGLPRRASAIKDVQATSKSLILDAGDLLAPFPSRLKDSVFVEAYRRIPLDAAAFGDQELIDGYDFFASKIKDRLPIISLNIYRSGNRLLKPYIVKEVNGIRIVITSLINKNAFLFYEAKNLGGAEIRDPSSELRVMLPELRKQGDVIILLSHLGIEEERKIAHEFPEIGIIVSGHTPGYFESPERVGKTFILGAGADAKHFGVADFRFEGDSLALLGNQVTALSDKYPEDPAVQRMVAPYIEALDVNPDSILVTGDSSNQVKGFHSPVEIDLFYAPDCDHCLKVMKTDLPRLAKRYPGLFTLKLHNIDKPEEFMLLEQWEKKAGDLDNDIPVLFFEGNVLGGEEEVTRDLERLLAKQRPDYSSVDSARYAGQSSYWNPDTSKTIFQDTIRGVPQGKREIVFFSTYGCNECDRVLYLLKGITVKDSTLVLRIYGTENPASKELLAAFDKVYNLPDQKRLLTPAVFVGRGYLVKSEINRVNLTRLLSGRTEPIPWAEIKKAEGTSHEAILEKFEDFRVLPIIGAGLIDGINPCAFATLIFFITYLSVLGVERRRILWLAIPFILSVFLTYFLVGLVAYQILEFLKVLRWVSVVIFGATVVFLVVLAVLSFNDYLLLRRGEGEKMSLKLPDRIRKRLNKIIKERTTFGGFVIGAVVTGFFVSVFELICTGQVYLPTLVYMAQVSEMQSRALLYLLIYNVSFIIPLVIVFILARFGMTERHLQTFLSRRAALTKILTAVLFLCLAGLMGYLLIRSIL